jgi:adenylate kinase family enzyme
MRERLKRRAESSRRVDDNPEVIENRIRTFQTENLLVEQHLQRNGRVETVRSKGENSTEGLLT